MDGVVWGKQSQRQACTVNSDHYMFVGRSPPEDGTPTAIPLDFFAGSLHRPGSFNAEIDRQRQISRLNMLRDMNSSRSVARTGSAYQDIVGTGQMVSSRTSKRFSRASHFRSLRQKSRSIVDSVMGKTGWRRSAKGVSITTRLFESPNMAGDQVTQEPLDIISSGRSDADTGAADDEGPDTADRKSSDSLVFGPIRSHEHFTAT